MSGISHVSGPFWAVSGADREAYSTACSRFPVPPKNREFFLPEQGFFVGTENCAAARQAGDKADLSPAAHLARPRRELLQPLQRPAATPACSALIVLEEKGVFRFAKMTAAVGARFAWHSGPQRHGLGHSKTGRAGDIRRRIHAESLSRRHNCSHPPTNLISQ